MPELPNMSAPHLDALKSHQRFLNNPSTAAFESLLGLVMSNPHLALLDFGKVVVRKDYNASDQVKIVSGCGSGYEPAFAGLVGKGMLTASVQGEILTSPPAGDILKTIREMAGESNHHRVLVIIPNTLGDRLNFGLAVERAQSEGIGTKMLIVSDDVTTSTLKQKRGLSGTLLIQKIAGAMAEDGCDLTAIYNYCEQIQKEVFSILVSLKPCSEPDHVSCSCKTLVAKTEMEIGAGLHGENGRMKMSVTAVEHVCKMIFEQMTNENNPNKLVLDADVPVVLLVNNLGTISNLEEYIFIKELLTHLMNLQVKVLRLYNGRYLTSLNTNGFTVTIFNVKDTKAVEYLDAPCDAPCWRKYHTHEISSANEPFAIGKIREEEPVEMRGPRLSRRQSNTLLLVVQFACDALISCERQLNAIDSESGDGDTGTRIKRGVDVINGELTKHALNLFYPFTFFLTLSRIVEKTTGGTMGCLYSILFEAAAKEFMAVPETNHVGAWMWLYALKRATQALMMYAQVEEGDNTLYDPLCACAKAVEEALDQNMNDIEAFGCGVVAAEEAAQRTKVPSKRYPDPGAHAVGIWMRAVYEGVKLRCE